MSTSDKSKSSRAEMDPRERVWESEKNIPITRKPDAARRKGSKKE